MADPITNSVVGIAGKVLGKFVADKNLKMQLEHELKTQLQTANLAQIEVNKLEAQHKSIFVSGWRPSVGWCCSLAMMYHFIIAPMIQFGIKRIGVSQKGDVGARFIHLDMDETRASPRIWSYFC